MLPMTHSFSLSLSLYINLYINFPYIFFECAIYLRVNLNEEILHKIA